jgi:hypothetical protein
MFSSANVVVAKSKVKRQIVLSDSSSDESASDSSSSSTEYRKESSSSEEKKKKKGNKKGQKGKKDEKDCQPKFTAAPRRLDLDQKNFETPKKGAHEAMFTISNSKLTQQLEGSGSPKTPSHGALKALQDAENEAKVRNWSGRWLNMKAPSSQCVEKMLLLFPSISATDIGKMLPGPENMKAPRRWSWMLNLYSNLGLPIHKRLRRDDSVFVDFTSFYTYLTGFERAEVLADITDFRKNQGVLVYISFFDTYIIVKKKLRKRPLQRNF